MNICAGKRYRVYNFPKKKFGKGYVHQSPSDKIRHIEILSTTAGIPHIATPIREFHDPQLRNTIFHSDYAVVNGEVHINDPPRIYSHEETLTLINKSFAYHEVLRDAMENYRRSYTASKVISTSPGFSPDPQEKAVLIVRKGHGIIGMKSTWTKEEVKQGKIDYFVGHVLPYEMCLINEGHFVLPRNKIELWNRILHRLPRPIAKLLSRLLEDRFR